MADALKGFFDAARVRTIGASFLAVDPTFPLDRFVAQAVADLEKLELIARARHIATALARALPADRARALDVLVRSLGPPIPADGTWGMAPFVHLPLVYFVAEHGLDHPEAALDAQHALTQRFTAEFSLRAYLERWPERTFARLAVWAEDPDAHVRRLVSEGTRSRLPWAPRLRALQADPAPVLALLERLRDDPSAYVRRSVANNLNDIGKDHPDVLRAVCERWLVDAPEARRALVRHALRDRVKKGDVAAIGLLGGGGTVAVAGVLPPTAALGGRLDVVVEVRNVGDAPARFVVDLAVGFPGAREGGRRKVFKLRTVDLAAGDTATLRKGISLAEHSTRRALPGPHTIAVQVNGVTTNLGVVEVA
jgi:3-methyladenine DNA glycosylase AlkC